MWEPKFIKRSRNPAKRSHLSQKGFHCTQKEAEYIYKEVEEVCTKELSVKFNWSAYPKTYKDKTAYAAYGTLLVYYTGIPSREALCLEGKHEGRYLRCAYIPSFKLIQTEKKKYSFICLDFKLMGVCDD